MTVQAIAKDNRLVINVRATPAMLAFLPMTEGRRTWLKGGGLSLEDTTHNRNALVRTFGIEVETKEALPVPICKPPENFIFHRTPDGHQLNALTAWGDRPVFELIMEQGTGKTKVCTDRAQMWWCEGKIDAVIIVTKKGVHRQWAEVQVPLDAPGAVTDYWRGKLPAEEVMRPATSGPVFWCINYDGLKTNGGWAATAAFAHKHKGRIFMVCDESQEIRNVKSGRHKACSALKPFAPFRALSTGTPVGKDLTDEWAQLMWLDESIIGCRYITTFRSQFCIMGGYEGKQIIGQKNVDAYRSRIDPWRFRVTKAEIGYLPKRYDEWVFDITADQKKMIKQIKQDLATDLPTGASFAVLAASTAFNKLQQIANGFLIDTETSTCHRIMPVSKNPRAIAALEWLEAGSGKAIIWCRYREDIKIMGEALNSAGISFSEYHGGVNAPDRKLAVDSFSAPSGAQVFLANPQAAGTGIDGLQTSCSRALYYSNSFNAIDRWQSEDRLHRRGMATGTCNLTDLIAVGSTDRYIRRNITRKQGTADLSVGDMSILVSDLI